MRIGIDASRAFLEKRTGIEEYAYQVIKNLRDQLSCFEVCLYLRKKQTVDFEIPANWKIKVINWPFFWTQGGLSLEMLFHPVEALFIPAHTVPLIHPKKSVVTIHGLEYEFCPKAYSLWERIYMRVSIRKSCQWASRIVSVSENTKKDLLKLYQVPEKKIEVVYEGFAMEHGTGNMEQKKTKTENDLSLRGCNHPKQSRALLKAGSPRIFDYKNSCDDQKCSMFHDLCSTPFLLFLGRIEERKNVENIIKAFEILKEKYQLEHKLVLAGKPGFGFEKIQNKIQETRYNNQIISLGFVSEEEKWELLKKAEVFVFPTQYEGFGIPILEAQSVGCPVVASNNSSVPEIVQYLPLPPGEDVRRTGEGHSALLVDPQSPQEIAEAIYKIFSNQTFKKDLIEKGLENVKRFSWEKCARKVAGILEG